MKRAVDILTSEERASCEARGRAALDAVLGRLTDSARAEIWHSIRCGYVHPTTGAAAKQESLEADVAGARLATVLPS